MQLDSKRNSQPLQIPKLAPPSAGHAAGQIEQWLNGVRLGLDHFGWLFVVAWWIAAGASAHLLFKRFNLAEITVVALYSDSATLAVPVLVAFAGFSIWPSPLLGLAIIVWSAAHIFIGAQPPGFARWWRSLVALTLALAVLALSILGLFGLMVLLA